MGEQTGITWTDHTMNFWWGCTNVSPGCDHCYAETLSKRYGFTSIWGPHQKRRTFQDKHWNMPYDWNRKAIKDGARRRVFTNSMADFFDAEVPQEWRERAWTIMRETQALDWQVLTKRAHRIKECLPADWGAGYPNVWLGVSAENQEWADTRIPKLLAVPAVVRFVSAEPLLGQIDMNSYLEVHWEQGPFIEPRRGTIGGVASYTARLGPGIDWVIVGGESGYKGRPMDADWARSLRDQCAEWDIAYFFKQWGQSGGDPKKHHGGDLLDGRQWHGFPSAHHA